MGIIQKVDTTGEGLQQGVASGVADSPFEGISPHFTDMSMVSTTRNHVLVRARRYGRWFLLKGLTQESRFSAVCQAMLRKELEVLMRLQHPHVVQAVGFENVDTLGPCIIMEWIEGCTLKEWLQGPAADAAGAQGARRLRERLAMELLQAVAYVHSMGIVHRDLKPQNVMVTRNGQSIKLIDFSLADSDGDAVLKQPAGTPAYMAAEQQKSDVPDVRNDIYSLGLVLEEMGLGHRFAPLVRRCQQPIESRYQDMGELLEHFDRLTRSLRSRSGVAATMGAAALAGAAAMALFMVWQGAGGELLQRTTGPKDFSRAQELAEKRDSTISSLMHDLEQKDSQIVFMRQALEESAADAAGVKGPAADAAGVKANPQLQHAIAVGKRKVDERVVYWNVDQILDTLSRWEWRPRDLQVRINRVGDDVYTYFDGIENMFSEEELQKIRTEVLDYWKAWNERTMRRIEAIRGQ